MLTVNMRRDGNYEQVRALLSPAGRELLGALGRKIDRETQGSAADRHELKLHGA